MKNSFIPFKYFYIEVWKSHPIYTDYQASNFGRIRSLNYRGTGKPQILKQIKLNKYGYLVFCVCVNGKVKTIRTHRFVWECWNDLIPDGMEIDHIDTNKSNNYLTNLRLGTHKENSNNPLTLKHMSERKHTLESKLKISEANKKPIIQYSKSGEFIKEWSSATDAANELQIDKGHIGKCCKGKLKSTGGYIWKYA